jgi:hypothetical protein
MSDPNLSNAPDPHSDPDLIDDDAISAADPNQGMANPSGTSSAQGTRSAQKSQQPLSNPVTVMFEPFLDPRRAKNPYRGIKRFLIFASGARPEILAQCPTDEATHLGLGGTVIATSLLSAISMIFAMTNALQLGIFEALVAGLLWGLIIFNLDRWLIVSQKRLASAWKQWVNVIPRVIVALLLGFVISEPLIHQLFRSELDRETEVILASSTQEDLDNLEAKTRLFLDKKNERLQELSDTSSVSIGSEASLRTEIEKLQKEVDDAQAAYNTAQTELTAEIEGISATGRAGCGQACAVKQQVRDQKLDALNQVKERNDPRISEKRAGLDVALAENNVARQTLIADRETEKAQITEDINNRVAKTAEDKKKIESKQGTGLLADIDALHKLEGESGGVFLAHYLILFLFVALDTIPVIGKTLILTGPKRPYELVCDAIDSRTKMEAEQLVADAEYEQEQHVNLIRADADIRTQVQIDNNEFFIRAAADTQREVGELLLDEWRANEVARVQKQLTKKPPKPI